MKKDCPTEAQGPEWRISIITQNNYLFFYLSLFFKTLSPFFWKRILFQATQLTLRFDLATSPASTVKESLKLSTCKLHWFLSRQSVVSNIPNNVNNFHVFTEYDIQMFQSMGKFCSGTLPNALISTGNTMKLEFVSDSSLTKPGFQVKYQVSGKYCVTNIFVWSGTIFSLCEVLLTECWIVISEKTVWQVLLRFSFCYTSQHPQRFAPRIAVSGYLQPRFRI